MTAISAGEYREGVMPEGPRIVHTDRRTAERRHMAGDAAVDGLLAGTEAGVAMAAALVAGGLLAGEGPAAVLARFDPSGMASPLTGALVHLAVSAVYGLLFGVAYRLLGLGQSLNGAVGMLPGLIYGLALLLLAQGLSSLDNRAVLREVPAGSFAAAHLVYGLVLGWLIGRSWRISASQ
jgi:hypothetical protein